MTKECNDIGWMYHTPFDKQKAAKVWNLPPISNIPEIGNAADECFPSETNSQLPKPGHVIRRSYDTDFVVRSRQNGNPDLLTHYVSTSKRKEPVPYNRCEWFYTKDFELNDTSKEKEKKEEYVAKLPTYMVHENFQPNKISNIDTLISPRRADSPTPKMSLKKKEYELRPPYKIIDYGIWRKELATTKGRNSKVILKHPYNLSKLLLPTPKMKEDSSQPIFSKLLAHGYTKDWEEKRKAWHDEYRKVENMNKNVMSKHSTKSTRRQLIDENIKEWRSNAIVGYHPADPIDLSSKQSTYQQYYNIKNFKPSVVRYKPPKAKIPFPKITDDIDHPNIWKLMSHRYVDDYNEKWKKWNDDMKTYMVLGKKGKNPKMNKKTLK